MTTIERLFGVAGKNVLITGGSRGIGYMIAQGFVANGANVLITSRDEKTCREAASSLGCRYAVLGDAKRGLSTREGCQDLAEETSRVFHGRLDVLINNAGTSWGEPLFRNSRSGWGWDKVLDLNVKSVFYTTRACIPLLEDNGRIINTGSVTGLVPQAAPTHAYDVSKAALHHLTRKFAADLAPRNITVNAIAPGYVPTKMSEGLATYGADQEHLSKQIPLQRMGEADDMAGACIYLSSKAGAWCTGLILHVDGGTVGAMQIPLQ